MAAKQPLPDQLDQLYKDLEITSRTSDFVDVREMAADMLAPLDVLRKSFREYRRRVA